MQLLDLTTRLLSPQPTGLPLSNNRMPKITSTTSSCTVLGRPRRVSHLPARYRTDSSLVTAPPARRAADSLPNAASGTRLDHGGMPSSGGASGK